MKATDRELDAMANLLLTIDDFGPLHIIVSDGNVDDDNLGYCRSQPDLADVDLLFLDLFRRFSVEDRELIYERSNEICRARIEADF